MKHLNERESFEGGDVQDLKNCVEAEVERPRFFDDGDEPINRERDPDLGAHSVLGDAVEGLDPQMLLDPLEEQLDLPAAAVQLGDGKGWQIEVVGQKDISSDGSPGREPEDDRPGAAITGQPVLRGPELGKIS